MVSAKKREVADENHMSLSKWDEEPTLCVSVLKTWLLVSHAMEKFSILKNTKLRGTLRQTTFRN